jgi:hypothetical protein
MGGDMRIRILTWLMPVILVPSLASAAKPEGWFLAGSDPAAYEMQRDTTVNRDGKASGRLASIKPSKGFGTMMQSVDAGEYNGKRLRFRGYVKASKVNDWAGLWMRVDGASKPSLAFDNMQDRAIKGTKDWTRYDVVLDVPEEATGVFFGILLSGEGAVWLNDVSLEVVDASVPTTGMNGSGMHRKPTNLDFGH